MSKIPGRNPSEPIDRRPEPTPAPPMPRHPCYQPIAREGEDLANPKPPCGNTAVEAPLPPPPDQPAIQCGRCNTWIVLGTPTPCTSCIAVLDGVSELAAQIERIPCMSEYCDGTEDDLPVTKHSLLVARCHRCAAVRLARSILDGK